MKIIHAADLHIGAKVKNIQDSSLANQIKANMANSFRELVDYATNNKIHVIMLSGDVFDSDKVSKSDKKFFYDIIKRNPSIDFLYLRGNHDSNSIYDEEIDNLKTFEDEWKSYIYENIAISGVELTKTNYQAIYSSLHLDKNNTNIVMLHGNEATTSSVSNINISKLKNKEIDYLALGHIHASYVKKFEEEKELVYPGCLVGHGFDETGIKGFYVLDVQEKEIKKEFVSIDNLVFYHENVDVSSSNSELDVIELIESKYELNKNGIYEFILEGKVNYDLSFIEERIKAAFSSKVKYLQIKNKAYQSIDVKSYETDKSLKGEFVRNVLSKDYDDETKNSVIALGIKILNGEDVD